MPVIYNGGEIGCGPCTADENTDSYIRDVVHGIVVHVVLPYGAGSNRTGMGLVALLDGDGTCVSLRTPEQTRCGLAAPNGTRKFVSNHCERTGVRTLGSTNQTGCVVISANRCRMRINRSI